MATQNRVTRRRFLGRTAAIGTAGLLAPHAITGLAHAAGQTPARGGYRVGIYTRPWDRHDYRVALDAIAEAGFKHAGLMTTTTEGRRLVIQADMPLEACEKIGWEVKDRGMTIPSVYGGRIGVAKSLEQGIEDLKRLIDNCVAAGARSLLMGGTNEKLFDVYYQAIAECCDYAAEKGLPITVSASRRSATRTSASGTTRATSSSTPTASSIRSTTRPPSTASYAQACASRTSPCRPRRAR